LRAVKATILVLLVAAAPAVYASGLLEPGDVLGSVFVNRPAAGIAWSPAGDLLAVAYPNELRVYYVNGSLAWSVELPGPPSGLAWGPGDLVAVGVGDSVVVVNASGVVATASLGSQVNWVAWGSSDVVAAALEDGSVAFYSTGNGSVDTVQVSAAPLTSVAWFDGGLVAGDASGAIHLVSDGGVVDSVVVGSEVLGLAPSPDGASVAFAVPEAVGVATADRGGLAVASLDLEGEGFEAAGAPTWSPDGSTLAVPAGEHLLIVDLEGAEPANIATVFDSLYGYLYEAAAWNPELLDVLAAAGVDPANGYTRVYLLYAGSLVTLTAEPPVEAFCAAPGNCSATLEVNAAGTLQVLLLAYVDEWGAGPRELQVPASLTVPPARTLTITGVEALAEANVSLPEGKGLLLVLRAPGAGAEARLLPGGPSQALETQALLAPPGRYQVTVALEPPADWLGPDWALKRSTLVLVRAGEVKMLDYTWFTVDAVSARLSVESEPGARVTLYFENDSVTAALEGATAEYTVPAGSYTVEVALPAGPNVLVPDPQALAYRVAATLYPGDELVVSLRYSDLLGTIAVVGPEQAMVEVSPPWGAEPWTGPLDGGRVELLAAPATYRAAAWLEAPSGWVGPAPPRLEANLTVGEPGARVEWNLYHYPEVLEWLNLVEQAGVIMVQAPVGFLVVVAYGNETVEAGRGSVNLTAPPGEYTLRLVDPITGRTVDEETVTVKPGGTYAVVLDFTAPADTTAQAPAPQPTRQEDQGPSTALIAVAALAPLAVGAAAVLYLRRRQR